LGYSPLAPSHTS